MSEQKNVGHIISIKGPVIDIEFNIANPDDLPGIYDVIEVNKISGSKTNGNSSNRSLLFEVLAHLGANKLRAVALGSTFKLGRGMEVEIKNSQLKVPVGIMGRIFNTVGETVDDLANPITQKTTEYDDPWTKKHIQIKRSNIVKDPPNFLDVKPPEEILHTHIKVVDLISPIPKGGKIGFFGGAGVGKTVFLKELINTMIEKVRAKIVYAGIGERIREGTELWEEFRELHDLNEKKVPPVPPELNLLNNLVCVFGQMNEPSGVRFRTPHTAVTMAEYLRDMENKENIENNVLFFADNIFRFVQAGAEVSTLLGRMPSNVGYQPTLEMEVGDLEERITSTHKGWITSLQAVYVPADDLTDPAPATIFGHLDATIVLAREIAEKNLYPAVDPLSSNSNFLSKMDNEYIDRFYEKNKKEIKENSKFDEESVKTLLKIHPSLVKVVKDILEKNKQIEKIINLLGRDSISEEQKQINARAERITNFLTQPFTVAEPFSGIKGIQVPIWDTLFGILILCFDENIIKDNYDKDLFLYIGDLLDSFKQKNKEKNKEVEKFVDEYLYPQRKELIRKYAEKVLNEF